jgi:hypothetical protein
MREGNGPRTYIFSQCRILLQELHNAIGQLRVIHAETLHFVHREEDSSQEELVLLLERQGEAVDNGAQNLQQLSDTVVALCLIHELEEDIVDRSANV